MDTLEIEIHTWEEREVWLCRGKCKQYRHRPKLEGQLPAICCDKPAKFVTRYEQPKDFIQQYPIGAQ